MGQWIEHVEAIQGETWKCISNKLVLLLRLRRSWRVGLIDRQRFRLNLDEVGDEEAVSEEVARAIEQGYSKRTEPYHGYFFKPLKGQGAAAPLGQMDFDVNELISSAIR